MVNRKYGTRSEVWEDVATMTRGGLTKENLILSKGGKIVSKKKSEAAKANYASFGFNKRKEEEPKKKKRRRTKKKVIKSQDE